jgi:hypothetical protein|tara:strand:- start:8188 stop:8478 length:291 start_codon:yes stop_codon:yes gene_type:complete
MDRDSRNSYERKLYRHTRTGKRSIKISNWKLNGVICEDFKELYKFYMNCKNCEWCDAELTESKYNKKTTKCLDYDSYGSFRNIICLSCNTGSDKDY